MYNIAIVTSQFNEPVTHKLTAGAKDFFNQVSEKINVSDYFKVPGAVELPLFCSRLAKTKKYDAILMLGAVIYGETDHYDYVCQQVSYGCQQVALKYDIPVIFGILTCQTAELAFARVGGEKGNKGFSCAKALIETLDELALIE
ncbi:MAG: 6,7-dimethyl-8-ribityllumazine synthase [Legionellales bacterium]|mgnify:CR=1 FL=1|nr:6,7-dimethyl-8-ribityllumazine synthase [Legionellales bacterium]|tara:strand:+ start:454 stop:885 length:432 start_codon:yes stop_codon:yes gene_type:complete